MNAPATPRPGHRLWLPFSIGLLAVLSVIVVRLRPEMDSNFKAWLTSAIVLLATLISLIWFLFLSRFPWRTRLLAFAGLLVLAFGLSKTLKVNGTVDGTGLPKLVWVWTAKKTQDFSQIKTVTTDGVAAIALPKSDIPDVPQFLGPNRDGVIRNARLGRDWNAHPPKELWRQPIGEGWSAFAVVNGLAYTQEQRDDEELVTCYDLLTGRLVWTHANKTRFSEWQGGDGPRATPTVDRGYVFTQGATGILDCLDAVTGKKIWSRDVLKENKLDNITWGLSASPLVFEDTVVVTGGNNDRATVQAYHRVTGEPLWQAGKDKASYASPLLATLAGKRIILSSNSATLTGHDPVTGAVLLEHAWGSDKWPKAAQPLVLEGDRLFLSAGYGMGCQMLQIKAGADGKLEATELWKSLRMKTQFNNVSLRDGFIYGLDDGQLACLNAATGERQWKTGRYGSGQSLLADDLMIVQSEPGPVVLVEVKPESGREVGRLDALKAKTWNNPTLAGRYLLVRNSEEVVCYELPLEATAGK
ncbi:MAG: hypothetical protein RL693_2531 [Verrucomicrobiota bacterium]|jgi:outer membrane protein assembly factor BamB